MAGSEDRVDELYRLPLDQFTPARDALAKELRTNGDRAGADEIKALRKPNVPAWALNQLRRIDGRRLDELLTAGERLRATQAELLDGGDREGLAGAVVEERRLVGELVAVAEATLREAGHPVSPAVQARLRDTLHAAAADEQARELLRAGRLVGDFQLSDLGLLAGGAGPRAPARTEPRPPSPAEIAREIRQRLKAARAQERELRELADRARREADAAHKAAELAAADAEKAAEQAQKAAERVMALSEELRC